jgi:ABC-type branched-subunit amino acid transport system substrate-binding protein
MVVRRAVLVAALVLALAAMGLASGTAGAAGGGGGGAQFPGPKPGKASTPCTNDPGISDTQIKVGGILPQSGPSAPSFADSENGMRARFDLANATNELGRRKISFTAEDDAGDPARNVTAAQKLVEQDNVFGIVENSLSADASARYLHQKGVPVAGWHLGLASFGTYPNMFGWRNSFPPDAGKNTFTTLNVDFLNTRAVTKVALVGANTANSSTFVDQIDRAIKLAGQGIKVVYKTTSVTVDQRDFTAEAQRIKDSGADAVATGMDFLQDTALSAALNQDNYKVKVILFPAAEDSRILHLPGIEGAYFGTEVIPFELNPPAYLTYKAQMQKEGKFFEGEVPYIGWLSADTFIEGLKAAGVSCPTRKGFIKNLRAEKNWTAHGAFNPVDFAKAFGKPLYCVYFVQVQNATFIPQFGGKPFCASRAINGNKVTKLTPAQIANG